MASISKRIYVTGDIARDFFLFRGNKFYSDDMDKNKPGTNWVHHNGGAFLIYEFLHHIAEQRKDNGENEQLSVELGYNNGYF